MRRGPTWRRARISLSPVTNSSAPAVAAAATRRSSGLPRPGGASSMATVIAHSSLIHFSTSLGGRSFRETTSNNSRRLRSHVRTTWSVRHTVTRSWHSPLVATAATQTLVSRKTLKTLPERRPLRSTTRWRGLAALDWLGLRRAWPERSGGATPPARHHSATSRSARPTWPARPLLVCSTALSASSPQ